VRLPLSTPAQAKPIPKPARHRIDNKAAQHSHSEDEPWSGLLTLLALSAVLLTGAALLREATYLVKLNERFSLFVLVDVFEVALLPIMIGIFCRSEIHSILTMIALSAALQAILFRLAGPMPEGFFLALAALGLAGIPLGLAGFWGSIDRRMDERRIETTTGKLLRGKWHRMRTVGRSHKQS
jgi:hypothetical protein